MKKIIILLFIVFAGFLYAAEKKQNVPTPSRPKEQIQAFKPFLADIDNSQTAQNDILGNSYRIEDSNGGSWTGVRIHKNWFLTCAHGPFMEDPRFKGKDAISIHVSAKEYNAPGSVAPFALLIDFTKTGEGNGVFYKFNPKLALDDTNTGRGEDLALIYVPDTDPSKKEFAEAKKEIDEGIKQLNSLKGIMPGTMLSSQINMLLKSKKELLNAEKKLSSIWHKFLNNPVKPFHLFILSEKTVIPELGFPGKTGYSFNLNVYNIHSENLVKFQFTPIGTHEEEPNAIFYRRVNNLIFGTSGSPMTYGNIIVSIDSATNCSPMLTDKFYEWLKGKMKGDYKKGMCVKTNLPENAEMAPLEAETDRNWNNANPDPTNPGPLHPHHH